MNIFQSGIALNSNENSCLLHMVPDAEAYVSNTVAEKAQARRDALIIEWRPILYADPSVTELPADADSLASLIIARSDYQSRAQKDAAATPAVETNTENKERYDAVSRSGSTVTLFSSGMTIADLSASCILSSVQNLEEWVYGAVLGMVNRGKKNMIAQYHPIIMADASVTTMPATEDGLITMILARSDYQRLGG
jgi:hypothetical protein